MIDTPGRPPRFPPSLENVVRGRIANQLDRWNVGAGDLAMCGGARGGDILFAELCWHRGADVQLMLALSPDVFVETSVRLEDSDWIARFHTLVDHCTVLVMDEAAASRFEGENVFARANRWMVEVACERVPCDRIHAVLVWDGEPSPCGAGGTADFHHVLLARIGLVDERVAIIDPTNAR